jgi:putative membrane protein
LAAGYDTLESVHGETAQEPDVMTGFILRACITALGLWLATRLVSGIRIDNPSTIVLAGVLLGVVNAIVRPVAILLTLPLTILTLGLFLLVVNTAMVGLVAAMLPGFHIFGGFWSAFATAVVVGVTGWIGSSLIGPRGKIDVFVRRS